MDKTLEALKEVVKRGMTLHSKLGEALQGVLRCGACGKQEACSTQQASTYLSSGWPKCCGYTMVLEKTKKAQP